jgi:two-component system chemotaxis sensor kinase CheA
VVLEARPDDEEALGTIFRATHTLKGNASSLGFQALTEFAHVVEDILDRLRKRELTATTPLVTLLLRSIDALRQMVPDAVQTKGRPGNGRSSSLARAVGRRRPAGTDEPNPERPTTNRRREGARAGGAAGRRARAPSAWTSTGSTG